MTESFSLHKIYQKEECPFSEADYSYFKFGDTAIAEKFAFQLFEKFIQSFGHQLLNKEEIYLLPSPYFAIPTASNYLCLHFKKHLNRFLFENMRPACKESKIYRQQTYTEDYGNMSFEERIRLIANDTYYIDKKFIENKFCIFIDDIKISGSHEKTILKILNAHQIKGEFLFLYFAELVNSEIHPNIENHYNYFAVKSVQDIIQIIHGEKFKFNTRMIKYILNLNDENFDIILEKISLVQKLELFDLAISNNYHQINTYQPNINKLNANLLWQSTCKKGKEKTSMPQSSPLV